MTDTITKLYRVEGELQSLNSQIDYEVHENKKNKLGFQSPLAIELKAKIVAKAAELNDLRNLVGKEV